MTDLMVGVREEMYRVISTRLVGRWKKNIKVTLEVFSQNLKDQKHKISQHYIMKDIVRKYQP